MAKETWDLVEDNDIIIYDNEKYEIVSNTNRFDYSHVDDSESWRLYILTKKKKTKGNMEVWAIFNAVEIRYDTDYHDEDLAGTTEMLYRSDIPYDIGSEEEVFETWNELD